MSPGPRLTWLCGAWLAAALLPTAWPGLLPAWGGLGVAFLVVAWFDARAVMRSPPPVVERTLHGTASLHTRYPVVLHLQSRAPEPQSLSVFDHHPPGDEPHGLPAALVLPPHASARVRYEVRPLVRGPRRFERVELTLDSPLGIWRRRLQAGDPTTLRVYPNFASVAKYALLATHNRISPVGVRRQRRRGEGLDFHQLREYRDGDTLRQVDWKASARTARLISREYQEERDQQVCFLLDCGHRMWTRDDESSHFDHGLNAMMLLAHVALAQGDAVGLMTFGGPLRYVPPRKGGNTLHMLLECVYDLQPGGGAPDYALAATRLARRLARRSLVVVVTNLRDEDTDEILPALELLRRRHLVILASLREPVIGAALGAPVDDFESALRNAATHRYLLGRRRLHDGIASRGVLSLDVEPARLPARMLNRYLEVKGSGRL